MGARRWRRAQSPGCVDVEPPCAIAAMRARHAARCNCHECQRREIWRQAREDIRGWRRGKEDHAIVAAVHLLANHGIDVPIGSIRVQELHETPSDIAHVWDNGRGRLVIRVSPTSEIYQAAQDGQPLGLAAVLLHEQHHVLHGEDEEPCYRREIEFLRQVSAPAELLDYVVDAARGNGVVLDVE